MALPFADTIPAATQRELLLAGQRAEVLNFGTQRFTIVHLSAQLQAYVHQFQPDVVVVVLDTTRADHVSAYGYARPTTPGFDAFAARAILFERAYATSSWTVPSHASLFTGLYPIQHGATQEHTRLDEGASTLAEVLGANGYRTFAVSANPLVSIKSGLARGFDEFVETWRAKRDTPFPTAREHPNVRAVDRLLADLWRAHRLRHPVPLAVGEESRRADHERGDGVGVVARPAQADESTPVVHHRHAALDAERAAEALLALSAPPSVMVARYGIDGDGRGRHDGAVGRQLLQGAEFGDVAGVDDKVGAWGHLGDLGNRGPEVVGGLRRADMGVGEMDKRERLLRFGRRGGEREDEKASRNQSET